MPLFDFWACSGHIINLYYVYSCYRSLIHGVLHEY